MSDLAFFDTNILLYMYDRRDAVKRSKAAAVFGEHLAARTLVISAQVLQEFYLCATTKLSLPAAQARALISDFSDLRVVTVAAAQILRAAEIAPRLKLSFWDALIVSAAESAGASLLLTEDLSHGHSYLGVRARNPFL
jgi:predicted nucleic acid-binding protein